MDERAIPVGTTAYAVSKERTPQGTTIHLLNGDGLPKLSVRAGGMESLDSFVSKGRQLVGSQATMGDVADAYLAALLLPAPLPPDGDANTANREGRANRANRASGLILMRDLAEEEEATVDWALNGRFAAGSFNICAGRPKAGKSTLMRQFALSYSRKEPFLGFDTSGGTVLWLALEERRQHVRQSFVGMGAAKEPIMFHIGPAPDNDWESWLRAIIAESGPSLVVIDHLQRLLRLQDINSYSEVGNKLEPLVNISREMGCCVVALHHTGKMERSDEGDDLLGSTALYGAVDCLLTVKRDSQGRRTISTRQREGDDLPPTLIQMDDAGGIALVGAVATIRRNEVERDIGEALGTDELTEDAIRERVGGNTTAVARALRSMVAAGTVVKRGDGKKGSPFSYASAARP